MPAPVLEGYEPSSAQASDCFRTGIALFSKQFSVAINAIGIVRLIGSIGVLNGLILNITCCKSLASQGLAAVATIETVPVPGLVTKGDSAGSDNLFALGAFGGVLVLVTFDA